jgi:hypothetical protein
VQPVTAAAITAAITVGYNPETWASWAAKPAKAQN